MDHRALIKNLTPCEHADLTRKSNWPGIAHLAIHFGIIILLGTLIALRIPYWPAIMIPQGVAIVFLFTLAHETAHRTAFKTGWLNKSVNHVCCFLIFLPPEWFRLFHFEHHRHTQDPARDPELATAKPETLGQYLWALTGLPVWASQLKTLTCNALGQNADRFVPAKAKNAVRREAQIMLAAYAALLAASLATGNMILVAAWLVPILIGQPFLRAFLMAEHTGCPTNPDMLANSRTLSTNAAVRFISWNMPYHAEHHTMPAVPYHRLAGFHAKTGPHLGTTEAGYLRFHTRQIAKFLEDR